MFSRATRFLSVPFVLCGAFGVAGVPPVQAEEPTADVVPMLQVSDFASLAELSNDYFQAVPDAALANVDRIVAFEENERFVYLAGASDTALRRILLLKPSTFIVEDRVVPSASKVSSRWAMRTSDKLETDGKRFLARSPQGRLVGETVWPRNATTRIVNTSGEDRAASEYVVETGDGSSVDRCVHVLHLSQLNEQSDGPRCELTNDDHGWLLKVTVDGQVLKLSLPSDRDAVGTIAINTAQGRSVLQERLLPSSIMPYGEDGVGLIQRWDTPYHGDRRPGWDTGRVAPELKKLVQMQPDRRGRAVVLGCGTGTNAIYLASQGFAVIGVDVAPTALARAQQKAREAGVKIRWVLADVQTLPNLEPVEMIFDRGCYHHVRQYNAAGYVQNACRLAHPGTQVLLLAGSAKEQRPGGPPKISEEEIRTDFGESFIFEWFREIRFDSVNPNSQGPLAWSVLMRRKAIE